MERYVLKKEDILAMVLIIISICSVITYVLVDRMADKIHEYETTMIETDYCNDDFSECYRTYETFKDYIKNNTNR